ncbi:MAG: hypothetical protein QM765_11355 [Myxococcales bacterium]
MRRGRPWPTRIQREHVYWHELRSPIGTLISLLDVAADAYAQDVPPELLDLLQRARRQAYRLSEMAAAAHDMERLRWGALSIRKQPLELPQALQQAVSAVAAAAEKRGVALEVRPAAPLVVMSDAVLLGRCLECLLRASVEASVPGGAVAVEIALADEKTTVRAHIAKPANPEGLAVAFTLESALGIRGGTALGLHEVKLLVEAMGGAVAVNECALELCLPRGA